MEETGTQAAPARAFKPVTHTDRQTDTQTHRQKQTKNTHTVPYAVTLAAIATLLCQPVPSLSE